MVKLKTGCGENQLVELKFSKEFMPEEVVRMYANNPALRCENLRNWRYKMQDAAGSSAREVLNGSFPENLRNSFARLPMWKTVCPWIETRTSREFISDSTSDSRTGYIISRP